MKGVTPVASILAWPWHCMSHYCIHVNHSGALLQVWLIFLTCNNSAWRYTWQVGGKHKRRWFTAWLMLCTDHARCFYFGLYLYGKCLNVVLVVLTHRGAVPLYKWDGKVFVTFAHHVTWSTRHHETGCAQHVIAWVDLAAHARTPETCSKGTTAFDTSLRCHMQTHSVRVPRTVHTHTHTSHGAHRCTTV